MALSTSAFLTQALESAIRENDELKQLLIVAEEVIIFGSYACACQGPSSDLDVLVIGDELPRPQSARYKTKSLDLMYVPKSTVMSRHWLGSELASHIATFGVWLRGEGQWRNSVKLRPFALERKREGILSTISTLYLKSERWSSYHLFRHLAKCCLDVVRLCILARHASVPARQMLMERCLNTDFIEVNEISPLMGEPVAALLAAALGCPLDNLSNEVERRLRNKWERELNRNLVWREERREQLE